MRRHWATAAACSRNPRANWMVFANQLLTRNLRDGVMIPNGVGQNCQNSQAQNAIAY